MTRDKCLRQAKEWLGSMAWCELGPPSDYKGRFRIGIWRRMADRQSLYREVLASSGDGWRGALEILARKVNLGLYEGSVERRER